MKVGKPAIGRTVDQPDADIRFYLLHGPDDAQSRALGARLVQALSASRFLVPGGTIKSDPATLADEAGAIADQIVARLGMYATRGTVAQ